MFIDLTTLPTAARFGRADMNLNLKHCHLIVRSSEPRRLGRARIYKHGTPNGVKTKTRRHSQKPKAKDQIETRNGFTPTP
jgi:hypothetical protein